MKCNLRSVLCLGLGALVALAFTPQVFAQGATTGSITGFVLDPDGAPLPGASVVAIHTPTGTRYTAYSQVDGRFNMHAVRTGGPYQVTVTLTGFTTGEDTAAQVTLGQNLNLTFTLRLASVEETITVTAVSDPIINPGRTGATSNVSLKAIETLPSMNRQISDFARLDPFFSTNSDNSDPTSVTVAGRNNRYNNIQIDGSVNNDLFGLADQGTPGGQTETNPISLDAVEEFQLVVSPYDVRQGVFSGGGINMVSRSGSNAFHGSGYLFTRSNALVGNGPSDREYGDFTDRSFGGRIGGPIVKDRLFFFFSGEATRRNKPSGYSIGGATGNDFRHHDEAARFQQIMRDNWGHDVGSTDEFIRATDNDLYFIRADANITDGQQLTIRHNYVDGGNQIIRPSSYWYNWPDNVYDIAIKTNSFVTQLNSVFGNDIYNELRFTFQTIKGPRTGPVDYPGLQVGLTGGDWFGAGTERYSTANNLDQDIIELNDDLTFYKDGHTITIGTHNEFFKFDNLFIRDNFGYYRFETLDDLEKGWASQYDYSFSNTSDPHQSAKFPVHQFGFYAGDNWQVKDNFLLTFGIRMDVPFFPDTPTANADVYDTFGYGTDVTPSGNTMWSPRVGFNWDVTGNATSQLRGGVGLFSGRTPYVWLSNQYSNTGIQFTRLSARLSGDITADNPVQFTPDPYSRPTDLGGAATNEVNVIDPDFKFPSVMRTTIGYDHELGWQGVVATAEFVYSTTTQDILYQNLNTVASGANAFDGRAMYTTFDSDYSNTLLLANTQQGNQWNAVFKVQRRFRDGWAANGSYMYGSARSINDGNSSQAYSNWRYNNIANDPNNPELARSDYDVAHRINLMLSYDTELGNHARMSLGFFYDGQSGRPYSSTFSYDMNGDWQSNDLLYVPASPDEVIVTGGTTEQFWSYIMNDPGLADARGSIVERNASRAPWRNFTDFRAAFDIPIASTEVEISLDITNFLNLLNSNWGTIKYGNYDELSPFRYRGNDASTGLPIYELQSTARRALEDKFTTDDLRSRWQMKLGFRFTF